MNSNETPPIVAPDSPLPDQAWSALRAVILVVTAFALGRGWIAGDLATVIGTIAGIIGPVVLSQLKTRSRAMQLTAIRDDDRVPSEVVK